MQLPSLNLARKRTNNKVNKKIYEFDNKYYNIGHNLKYFLKTYGCQMNEHDSENIEGLLIELGFTKTDEMDDSNIIILNTCSIRENAHNKAFGMLGRIKHLKENNNNNIIVCLCGCMAQEEVVVNEILDKYKFVNFVFGTHNLYDLPRLIYENIENKKTDVCVYSYEGDLIENIPVKRSNNYKAYVNIIYGCDKFCTYCIVPYTRGKQRSREMSDIINEVLDLKKNGYQEVTLLGQNVNAYGKDLENKSDLAILLKEVSNTRIPRIRFITSHPWDFTDEMINVIKENSNIMPYIHLPLQSGSNRILKLMGRKYTREEYKILFNKLKEIPNVSITTDIIVGFPFETENDFNDTIDMVNYCKYDSAFTFIYSPRNGTPASKLFLDDKTDISVKENHLYQLNEIVNKYSKENNMKLLNTIQLVLVEGLSNKDKELFGYTENNKLVNFKGSKDLIGKIVRVKIIDAKSFSLDGEIIE